MPHVPVRGLLARQMHRSVDNQIQVVGQLPLANDLLIRPIRGELGDGGQFPFLAVAQRLQAGNSVDGCEQAVIGHRCEINGEDYFENGWQ